MGLHLPGSSFVNPGTELRDALTKAASVQATRITDLGTDYRPIGHIVDEKSVVNGIVALLATGGSTNHTMHLVAMARAAGIIVNWDDFDAISSVTPLIARIYPNGQADINHFQAAGGMAYLFKQLIGGGLLHQDVKTICGDGLELYTKEPKIIDGELTWVDAPDESLDKDVLATVDNPFKPDGGCKVLEGNLGRAVIKTSSLREGKTVVKAPAVVFESQHDIEPAFKAGELDKDCVVVVRFQGPRAVGMPELHKLTPPLSVLQDKGFNVALVTDGRMSGASGKVPAAIHLYPEALDGGLIAKVQDGDIIEINADENIVKLHVSDEELAKRTPFVKDLADEREAMGREMFNGLRQILTTPEEGAACIFHDA